MNQQDALKKWREFCVKAEEQYGPDWRNTVVGNVGWSGRLGDQWAEFGLISDPDAPPRSEARGIWQINDKPWRKD